MLADRLYTAAIQEPMHFAFDTVLASTRLRLCRGMLGLLVAVASVSVLSQIDAETLDALNSSAVRLIQTNYHNWPDSILMSNGKVEVVIVPAIGRVMQFKFMREDEGPLWNNQKLAGRATDPNSAEWSNFGGDKTWPAPEADWSKFTNRSWPPPPAFDSMPVHATLGQGMVTLVSPVDPFYGIRTHRQITLVPDKPIMRIETTYEKVEGDPKHVAVWIITQVRNTIGVYLAVPPSSIFPGGCTNQSRKLPPSLRVEKGLLSLARDSKGAFKIGSDADALLWVGEKTALLIESPRTGTGDYPDHGCSAEVYTNPDALPYVEMELLGPLHTMKVGDRIQCSSTYTLFHRAEASSEAEARRILGR